MLHFRPVLKCFSSSGNCLICSSNYFIWLKFFPCSKCRCIALNRTVWLNSDETSLCSQTLFLMFDNFEMLWIDFRNYHRHIRCPSVSAVVGNNWCLSLGICFLDGFNLVLGHIYSREYKVNSWRNLLYLIYIHNNKLFHCFRHWSIHFPSASYSVLVSLSSTSRACCNSYNFKPWMIL